MDAGPDARCSYDILHIHWPNNILTDRLWPRSAVKALLLQLALRWVRLRGRKVVWTAHDIVSHDQYHPSWRRTSGGF